MHDAIATAKRALRAELRERRQLLSQSARDAAAHGIRRQLDALVDSLEVRSMSCFEYSETAMMARARRAASADRLL